jgi:hypothetical protein
MMFDGVVEDSVCGLFRKAPLRVNTCIPASTPEHKKAIKPRTTTLFIIYSSPYW